MDPADDLCIGSFQELILNYDADVWDYCLGGWAWLDVAARFFKERETGGSPMGKKRKD
jgi:hypothetical protein